MRITHIDHYNIRLKPSDLKAIRDFYVNVLGLTDCAKPHFNFPGNWLLALSRKGSGHPSSGFEKRYSRTNCGSTQSGVTC